MKAALALLLAALAATGSARRAAAQTTPPPAFQYTASNCPAIAAALADIQTKMAAVTKAGTTRAVITLDCAGSFTDCPQPVLGAKSGQASLPLVLERSPAAKGAILLDLTIAAGAACATGDARPLLSAGPNTKWVRDLYTPDPWLLKAWVYTGGEEARIALSLKGLRIAGQAKNYGGVIFRSNGKGSKLSLTDVDITGCYGGDTRGGGLYALGYDLQLVINGGAISNNAANFGGGAYIDTPKSISITGTTFSGNSAISGGALMFQLYWPPEVFTARTAVIKNCVFTSNTAIPTKLNKGYGSAISLDAMRSRFKLSLPGTTFSGNGPTGSSESPIICGVLGDQVPTGKLTIDGGPTGVDVPRTGLSTSAICGAGYAVQT